MKKLQSNFTTPEQSKRLLELGVPAWTADCFRWDFSTSFDISEDNRYSTSIYVLCFEYQRDFYDKLPCWSVGRLIEIMKICAKPKEQAAMVEEILYCKDLVGLLVYMIEANKQVIDFSKLNEL